MRVWDTSHLLDTVPAGKQAAEHVHDYTDSEANRKRISHHFRQLQTRLVLGLLLGFLLPNALLTAYFHFQFTHTLKNSALLNLEAVAENERAVALYKSEGFEEYGRNPKGFLSRYSGFQELVYMRLDLQKIKKNN